MAEDEHQLEKLEIDRDQLAVCSSCGFSGKLIDVVAHADSCMGASSPSSPPPQPPPPTKKPQQHRNGTASKQTLEIVTTTTNVTSKRSSNSEVPVFTIGARKERDEGFVWPSEAVLLLIELYEQHVQMFSSPKYTKKSVWEKISNIMNERGYSLTGLQVDNKWKFLKRHYKKVKSSDNSSQQSWSYFEAMDQLASKVNLDSVPSDPAEDASGNAKQTISTETTVAKLVPSGPLKKKRKFVDIEPAWIKSLRLDMNRREQMAQRRHEEFIQVQRDNQMLFKEMMEKFIGAIRK